MTDQCHTCGVRQVAMVRIALFWMRRWFVHTLCFKCHEKEERMHRADIGAVA